MQHRSGWLVANLVAQLAYGLLAMTVCLPSMRQWTTEFGASQATVQLTFSGYVAAYGGLQLVYGSLSDRHGRKPLLLAGLLLAVAGSLLAAAARDVGLLIAARVLQGAGAAACMVLGRAMVQDLFTGGERTRVMAFIGMAMGLCPPLAILVGGQLHVRLGWQSNFLLMAVLGAVLFAATWWGLPPARPQPGTATGAGWRPALAAYARLGREPAFLLYVAILASLASTFYTFLGGAPLVLAGYGVPPERIGWVIMAVPLSYVAGNLLTTRLLRVLDERSLMAIGQAATLAGLLTLLALGLGGVHTPWTLAGPLLLLGIGHGLLVPPAMTGTVGLLPAIAGAAAAVAGLVQQLTGALGGWLVGLVPHHGPVALASQMIGWTLLGVVAQVVLFGWVRPRPRRPGG